MNTILFLIWVLFVAAMVITKKWRLIDKQQQNTGTSTFFSNQQNAKVPFLKLLVVKSFMNIGISFIVYIFITMINPVKIELIDSGNVGIKVSNAGDSRGIGKTEYVTGYTPYVEYFSRIYEFPIYQQSVKYAKESVITKGGLTAEIYPTFNYNLKPGKVSDMFANLRLPIKEIEENWLKNAVLGSITDVSNQYTMDFIVNNSNVYNVAIKNEVNKRVGRWFELSQLRANIKVPPSMQKSIEEKNTAEQKYQKALVDEKVAKAQGAASIAKAKSDSSTTVIAAAAQAKANQLKQQSATPKLLQQLWIERWNGQLPKVTTGNGGAMMLNLSDLN